MKKCDAYYTDSTYLGMLIHIGTLESVAQKLVDESKSSKRHGRQAGQSGEWWLPPYTEYLGRAHIVPATGIGGEIVSAQTTSVERLLDAMRSTSGRAHAHDDNY